MEKTLITKKATREAFGDEIVKLGKENKNIYVIDVDIAKSCKTSNFIKQLPDQHINVGIAEQNAAGLAAGLATTGKIPFVSTYAVFGSLRMAEQIRQEVCYPNLNVKIACSHGGLTPANDGGSHQAIEDMGVLRSFPNMTVIMGADYYSTRKLVEQAAKIHGPVYLRFTRDTIPVIYDENEEFTIGKAKKLNEGKDIAIIANGDTVHLALEATKELEKEGISVKLLDMHTIKPIDREAVVECLELERLITVEDHNILNGLGSAVCEVAAEEGKGKVSRIGVQDQFGQSAPYEKLMELNGITVENIIKTAKEML
jgi:transketolase